MEMSGIAQGLLTHSIAPSEQLQPAAPWGGPSLGGRGNPGCLNLARGGWCGRNGRRAGSDLFPVSPRLLQLQHHPAAPPTCQQAPLVLAPCDGALLVSGLQRGLGLGPGTLLPPHLLQAGASPVASAAQLLDAHLHISPTSAPLPAATPLQPPFAMLPPRFDPTGLPQGDCEMEDLTSGQLGTFVLVQ